MQVRSVGYQFLRHGCVTIMVPYLEKPGKVVGGGGFGQAIHRLLDYPTLRFPEEVVADLQNLAAACLAADDGTGPTGVQRLGADWSEYVSIIGRTNLPEYADWLRVACLCRLVHRKGSAGRQWRKSMTAVYRLLRQDPQQYSEALREVLADYHEDFRSGREWDHPVNVTRTRRLPSGERDAIRTALSALGLETLWGGPPEG